MSDSTRAFSKLQKDLQHTQEDIAKFELRERRKAYRAQCKKEYDRQYAARKREQTREDAERAAKIHRMKIRSQSRIRSAAKAKGIDPREREKQIKRLKNLVNRGERIPLDFRCPVCRYYKPRLQQWCNSLVGMICRVCKRAHYQD